MHVIDPSIYITQPLLRAYINKLAEFMVINIHVGGAGTRAQQHIARAFSI